MKKLIAIAFMVGIMFTSCKKDDLVKPTPMGCGQLEMYLAGHSITMIAKEDVDASENVTTTTPIYKDSIAFPIDLSGQFVFQYVIDTQDPTSSEDFLGRICDNELIVYNTNSPTVELNRWLFIPNPRHNFELNRVFEFTPGVKTFIVTKRN